MNPFARKIKEAKAMWRALRRTRWNGGRTGRRQDNRAAKRDARSRGLR